MKRNSIRKGGLNLKRKIQLILVFLPHLLLLLGLCLPFMKTENELLLNTILLSPKGSLNTIYGYGALIAFLLALGGSILFLSQFKNNKKMGKVLYVIGFVLACLIILSYLSHFDNGVASNMSMAVGGVCAFIGAISGLITAFMLNVDAAKCPNCH